MSITPVLRKIPIFSDLGEGDLERLANALIRRRYPKGQIIFHRGDEGGSLYILQSGRVKVVIPSPQGEEVILAILSPGEIIGELSLIDGKPRSATVETLEETAAAYRQLYERHAPLMRFLKDLNIPAPKGLSAAAELVVNDSLRRAFQKEEIDPAWVEGFLDDARTEGISLDVETLEYALRKRVEGAAANLLQNPSSLDALQRCQTVLELAGNLPFEVNLWEVQNIVYTLRKSSFPAFLADAEGGDEKAGKWVRRFKDLCERVAVRVD